MNISSILITLVGIIIIIALYVVSRLGQRNVPNNQNAVLPEIKDDNGDAFTSVLDDIPASDGSTIKEIPPKNKPTSENDSSQKHQVVLFISANEEQGLDGSTIKQALINNGLSLGDKDIYHYFIDNVMGKALDSLTENDTQQPRSSLFRVANGMEPWTLKDSDLENQHILGISLVMILPSVIDNKTAIATFIEKADSIATQVNGILKNQKQETLTDEERSLILGA